MPAAEADSLLTSPQEVQGLGGRAKSQSAVAGGCRLRGHCFLEISEPWSRAGWVRMQPVRVLAGTDAQVLHLFATRNVCPLGSARRFLFLPEEKVRVAASKIVS